MQLENLLKNPTIDLVPAMERIPGIKVVGSRVEMNMAPAAVNAPPAAAGDGGGGAGKSTRGAMLDPAATLTQCCYPGSKTFLTERPMGEEAGIAMLTTTVIE